MSSSYELRSFFDLGDEVRVAGIPFYKVAHAHAHGRIRLVAHLLLQRGHVSGGIGYIAGLERQQLLDRLLSGRLLDRRDVLLELHRVAVADVEDPVRSIARGRIRIPAVPGWVGRGNVVTGADHTFDDVIHVGEVARMISEIEKLDRLPAQDV